MSLLLLRYIAQLSLLFYVKNIHFKFIIYMYKFIINLAYKLNKVYTFCKIFILLI